jgi:hypothetical protein
MKRQSKAGAGRECRKKRTYMEKEAPEWQCRVCRETYESSVPYCLSCYHGLYYYCYVNAELFVQKDLAYLDIYYQTAPLEDPETETEIEGEQDPQDGQIHPDLNWIDTLLA